jgi:ribonuclease E
VWLPSGGSLIIEHTEALTVIDVNTGKNVGTSSLEETVFRNNLEAAEEVARQLRLRDIGGIIVVDFIDMEIRENRDKVVRVFREALSRDKTRAQVFEISELGLVEMTRKRIGEGLLESFSATCPTCNGRGVVLDSALLGDQ